MSGFPKKPEDCKRHRWLPVLDLRTLKPVEPRREQCWDCGTTHPIEPTPGGTR